jgi:hypothetical protein
MDEVDGGGIDEHPAHARPFIPMILVGGQCMAKCTLVVSARPNTSFLHAYAHVLDGNCHLVW